MFFFPPVFTESNMKFKEELENHGKKLEEALSTINLLKNEIEELRCEKRTYLDELIELKKVKKVLEEKLDSISSPNSIYNIRFYIYIYIYVRFSPSFTD